MALDPVESLPIIISGWVLTALLKFFEIHKVCPNFIDILIELSMMYGVINNKSEVFWISIGT